MVHERRENSFGEVEIRSQSIRSVFRSSFRVEKALKTQLSKYYSDKLNKLAGIDQFPRKERFTRYDSKQQQAGIVKFRCETQCTRAEEKRGKIDIETIHVGEKGKGAEDAHIG